MTQPDSIITNEKSFIKGDGSQYVKPVDVDITSQQVECVIVSHHLSRDRKDVFNHGKRHPSFSLLSKLTVVNPFN